MKKILVIDDDVLVLKTIKNLLVHKKFHVFTARDADEVFEIFERENVDLIICDIRMPGEDGLMLMARVKEHLSKKKLTVPFLFISGYASEDAPIKAIEMGASGYVLKPIDMDQLLSVVQKSIDDGIAEQNSHSREGISDINHLIEEFLRSKKDLIEADPDVCIFLKKLQQKIQCIAKNN